MATTTTMSWKKKENAWRKKENKKKKENDEKVVTIEENKETKNGFLFFLK